MGNCRDFTDRLGYIIVMVLSRNLYHPGLNVFDRMISAVMTEFQFMGIVSMCDTEELMPQTDSKQWDFALNQFFNLFLFTFQYQWISRTVREEYTVDLFCVITSNQLIRTKGVRQYFYFQSRFSEFIKDIAFNPKIDCSNTCFSSRSLIITEVKRIINAVAMSIGGFRTHFFDVIDLFDSR